MMLRDNPYGDFFRDKLFAKSTSYVSLLLYMCVAWASTASPHLRLSEHPLPPRQSPSTSAPLSPAAISASPQPPFMAPSILASRNPARQSRGAIACSLRGPPKLALPHAPRLPRPRHARPAMRTLPPSLAQARNLTLSPLAVPPIVGAPGDQLPPIVVAQAPTPRRKGRTRRASSASPGRGG
jgi:hypothetical protein